MRRTQGATFIDIGWSSQLLYRNQVREMNDVYHYLIFPNVANVMNAFDVEKHLRRLCIPKTLTSGNDRQREQMERSGYFSICGMVDGVCDALKIVNATSEDEEWELVRILVEVKNRVHAFADPPPLHDCIQMAIYFKMLDVQEGDLVQFMNEDEMVIHTTRVSWDLYPLKCRMYGDESSENQAWNIWNSIIMPRLYRYTEMIEKFRRNDDLRLSFLSAEKRTQVSLIRTECDFL